MQVFYHLFKYLIRTNHNLNIQIKVTSKFKELFNILSLLKNFLYLDIVDRLNWDDWWAYMKQCA